MLIMPKKKHAATTRYRLIVRESLQSCHIFQHEKMCCISQIRFLKWASYHLGMHVPVITKAADTQSKDARCWMLNCLAWSIDFGYSKWISVYCLWEVWPQLLLCALPICQQFCHDLFDQIKAQGWKQKEIHAESSGVLQ